LRKFPAADEIVDRAIDWLEDDSTRPFFLWLHLMDPHAPYYPKAQALETMQRAETSAAEVRYTNSFWARGDLTADRLRKRKGRIIELYDAGICWVDQQIRRLAQRLSKLKSWDECAMVVTADHGEEFLEHGGRFHTPRHLHEELVHVPLMLRVPGTLGNQVNAPFGLVDLAPTLLDAFELPLPASFRGRSWWQELKNGRGSMRPVFTECAHGCSNPLDREKRFAPRLMSVRKGRYKLIVNFASGKDELFDLDDDPKELKPLPLGRAPDARRELLEMAKQHIEKSRKARDYELRFSAQARELRGRWERGIADRPN
jgi:arylsulfatase A-like enzyme